MNSQIAVVMLTVLSFYAAAMTEQKVSASAGTAETTKPSSAVEAERMRQLEAIRAARAEAQRQLKEAEQRITSLRTERTKRDKTSEQPWARSIIEIINQNWLRPPISEVGTVGCTASIELAENGEVMAISFLSPCLPQRLQQSIENAIIKSSPLPLPTDPGSFRKHIKAHFSPSDEA